MLAKPALVRNARRFGSCVILAGWFHYTTDLQTNIGAKEKEAKLKRVVLLVGQKTDMEVNFIYRVLVGERDLFYG
jgi:hypothetical protein